MTDAPLTSKLETLLARLREDGGRYLLSVGLTPDETDAAEKPTFGGKPTRRWLTDEEYAALCSVGSRVETTTARLTNEQCQEVISFLEDFEWTGLSLDNVRTWDQAIQEARGAQKTSAEPAVERPRDLPINRMMVPPYQHLELPTDSGRVYVDNSSPHFVEVIARRGPVLRAQSSKCPCKALLSGLGISCQFPNCTCDPIE